MLLDENEYQTNIVDIENTSIETDGIDYTKSMVRSFEYYEVDPISWMDKKLITNITSSTIENDESTDTKGSASFDFADNRKDFVPEEYYIRTYLNTSQNGRKNRIPLGTHLIQTPKISFNGLIRTVSADAYTPLIELKEKLPPIGFSLKKNEDGLQALYNILNDYCRAKIIKPSTTFKLNENFVSNSGDNWLTFVKDLLIVVKHKIVLNGNGSINIVPILKTNELNPIYTFTDDNSSILEPDIDYSQDLYGIPNIVEVICTSNGHTITSIVKNEDINSPTSIINRKREIYYRDEKPKLYGTPTQEEVDEYAKKLLEELSSVEYTVLFSHGYYPVDIGDCVRLNYERAGLHNIKAKIIAQSITCKPECIIKEQAVFTKKYWG